MNIFLQIFLYLDVFIIGIVFSYALMHIRAHFKQDKPLVKTPPTSHHPSNNNVNIFPHELREKLIDQTSERYQKVMDRSVEKLIAELSITTEKINQSAEKLSASIIQKRLEEFDSLFKKYEESSIKELENSKTKTDELKNTMLKQINEEMDLRKQQLVHFVETKLSDTVIAFLLETMEHQVDLGSQVNYLISALDQHKEEFKQAIKDEA